MPQPPERTARERMILAAPILPTILRLAAPNAVTVVVASLVTVAETAFVGALGAEALAANAYVFPFLVLMQTMANGAMGGGVSSAVARAVGARDAARARALALHALAIATGFGLFFTVLMCGFGASIYGALGARGAVLTLALEYSNVLFAGVAGIWLMATLISVVRGTGDMAVPTAIMLATAALQVALALVLTHGAGPVPALGIAGIGWSTVVASAAGALATLVYLRTPRARVRVSLAGVAPSGAMFRDILRVGGVAVFFSLQNAGTVLLMSAMVAGFGAVALAGYGIGARLEMLQIPVVFGIGAALVPMVGMNVGAGQIPRARRIALYGALFAGAISGVIGLVFAVKPEWWSGIYTADPAVRAATAEYLQRVGPTFGCFGFGVCLYFATQGSGRILGPVLAATARLALAALGAFVALRLDLGYAALCWAIAAAMLAYALIAAGVLAFTPWRRPG